MPSPSQRTLPRADSLHYTYSQHTYLRSVLTLSSHLSLGLPTGLFPKSFLAKILYAFMTPENAARLAHLTLLYLTSARILCDQANYQVLH